MTTMDSFKSVNKAISNSLHRILFIEPVSSVGVKTVPMLNLPRVQLEMNDTVLESRRFDAFKNLSDYSCLVRSLSFNEESQSVIQRLLDWEMENATWYLEQKH